MTNSELTIELYKVTEKLETAEARNKRLMELLEEQYSRLVHGYYERAGQPSSFCKEKAEAAWQQYKQSNNL